MHIPFQQFSPPAFFAFSAFHLTQRSVSVMTYTKLHDYDETKDEDNIWFETSATPRNNDNHYLIYFVPGNPCLVAFYKPFLFELFKLLGGQGESSANVTVAASSLPGFEVHATGIQYCPSGLKQQITNVENLIAGCVKRYYDDHTIVKSDKLKVVLVAHSVGAYMVLEALRRRVEGLNDLVDMPLAGAVLLFPTVTEIARSWHGSMLKVRLPLAHCCDSRPVFHLLYFHATCC